MFQQAAEVGDRLRKIRFDLDLSQLAASQQLRISRERLANYEDGRTPLKVHIGLAACKQFVYSEKWLATGEGDPRLLMNLWDDPISSQLKPDIFFATAYKNHLAPRYEELLAESNGTIRFAPFGEDVHRDCQVMGEFVLAWHGLISREKMKELMGLLILSGNRFTASNIRADDLADPAFSATSDARDSIAFIDAAVRLARARAATQTKGTKGKKAS